MSFNLEHENKTISLPDFKDIPIGLVRKARHESPQNQIFTVLEGLVSDSDMKTLDKMPTGAFGLQMKAWTGGASLGDS